jgi:hypothetical protein
MNLQDQSMGSQMDQKQRHQEGEMRTNGRIISFAKWSHPVGVDEDYVELPWEWPEGTNWVVLDMWNKMMEEVQGRLLGGMPCYRKFSLFSLGLRTQDAASDRYILDV